MTHSRWALVPVFCVCFFWPRPAAGLISSALRPSGKTHHYVSTSRAPDDDIVQEVTPAQQVYEQKKIENVKKTPEEKEDRMLSTKTLYEILGASPDATRDELKRQYVTLARATHPDAIVGKSPEERENSEVLFTEVAAAWRILSDKKERQRYDRSLKAKAFTQDVEKLASEYAEKLVETAGPAVSQVLSAFFRKPTVTTATSLNVGATQVKQSRKDGKKVDLGSAIGNAVKAGMQVGRNIDRYELLKKSRELKLKSMSEIEKSIAIKGQLANVMNKRLSLSLRVQNSGLTADEALKLLEGLNTVDSVSLLEAIRMKSPVINEINCLADVEKDVADKRQSQEDTEKNVEVMREALWKADARAKKAVEAEIAARRALEAAQREVIATRQGLMDWKNLYDSAESEHRKASQEAEKVFLKFARKQERVRTSLRRKEEEVLDIQERATVDATLGLSDLERLRKEEEYLRAESTRLDERVKRMRSTARKLKRRSEQLQQSHVVKDTDEK